MPTICRTLKNAGVLGESLTLGTHVQEGYCSCLCLSVCVSVCLSVKLHVYIAPLEHLFVLKIQSCTQHATEVKEFVGIFPETAPLQRSNTASVERPYMYMYVQSAIFLQKVHMRIIVFTTWWH